MSAKVAIGTVAALALGAGMFMGGGSGDVPRGSGARDLSDAQMEKIRRALVMNGPTWVGYTQAAWGRGRPVRYASLMPTFRVAKAWMKVLGDKYKRVETIQKPGARHRALNEIEEKHWLMPNGNLGPDMEVRQVLGGRQVLVLRRDPPLAIPFQFLPPSVARRLRTIQIIESLQGPTGDLSVPVYQALTQRAQKAVDDGRVDRAIDLWGELAWYHDKYDPYLKHA